MERALRGGFPDVAWRERSALQRGVWLQRYIVDTGLAGAAARVGVRAVLEDADLLGRYADALGTAQLRAAAAFMQPRPALYHLRTEAGRQEVDLVVELVARRLLCFEFKAGVAPDARDARRLVSLRDWLGTDFVRGAVLHSDTSIYPLAERILAVPLCAL